jgi:outer membrane protein TolC
MTRHLLYLLVTSLTVLAGTAGAVQAQPAVTLTLADAIRMAKEKSEAIEIARAGESRADADIERASSQKLPQVNFTGSYTRTLASEFSSAFEESGPICAPLDVDRTQPLEDRVSELERAATCGSIGGGSIDFSNLPFGRRNIYNLGFTFSQALYAGGRITAQQQQASISRDSASMTTALTEAQLTLEVTRAFYNAALGDRLVTIAESIYQQAADSYEQTRQAYDAGRLPEFDVLTAQVDRDNQRPTVIRRRADRDLAYIQLRQVLEIPDGTPLQLEVDLENEMLPPPAPFAEALVAARANEIGEPLSLRQSRAVVDLRQEGVTIARAERLPAISVNSSLGSVGYPSSGAFPTPGDFRANWTLGAAVQVPLFTGGRLRAGERSAQADLTEARARMEQTQKLVSYDRATALQDLASAEALWEASAGTVQQAQRAYEIAELRNREGLSTQVELSDSRVSLQVAQANRALAARDVQVARARVALLPNLPAGAR